MKNKPNQTQSRRSVGGTNAPPRGGKSKHRSSRPLGAEDPDLSGNPILSRATTRNPCPRMFKSGISIQGKEPTCTHHITKYKKCKTNPMSKQATFIMHHRLTHLLIYPSTHLLPQSAKTNPISKIPIPSGYTLPQSTRRRPKRVYPLGACPLWTERAEGYPLRLGVIAQNKANFKKDENNV